RDVLAAYPAVPPERVHVIHNGIDTTLYRPDPGTDALAKHGIDPDRPYVLFVGRITRQTGVPHLVRAGAPLDPGAQLVLCAGGGAEVVEDGRTGLLVHYDEQDAQAFEAGLAAALNEVVGSPDRAAAMGTAGRERAVGEFGWKAIAERTVALYEACGRSL